MPDMDSEIPRVNLDDYRDLAEPTERPAASEVFAGQLATLTANGVAPYDTDGSAPSMILVVHNARQRGMEWGDTYPGGQDVLIPLLRGEGGYLNLPLAAGESVTGDVDALVPAAGGAVRAYVSANDNASAIIGTPTEDVDNTGASSVTAVATEVHY